MAVRTVSIVGVGLIGGSFALGLRKAGFDGRIVGVSSPAALAEALRLGAVDEGLPLEEAAPQSDLIYMAQPVARILQQLESVAALAPAHALVTDTGSTKGAIVERARKVFPPGGAVFLGGHPMAGKEGRGVGIAEADLFAGAVYVLAPAGGRFPDSAAAAEFCAWLDKMGCRRRVMDAAAHDRVTAWTSHLPQLVSTALAGSLLERVGADDDLQTAGNGLRDMTRLAAGSYAMWEGILETNRAAVDDALGAFIADLEALRAAAREGAAGAHFERGQRLQKKLPRG